MILRLASSIFLMVLSIVLAAEQVAIDSVRIWAAPENTRVVFDMNGPVEHTVTTLENPARMVIDFTGVTLNKTLPQPVTADRFVEHLRQFAQDKELRIVLDLKKTAQMHSFQLPPNEKYSHRLVVDISDATTGQYEIAVQPVAAQPVTETPTTTANLIQEQMTTMPSVPEQAIVASVPEQQVTQDVAVAQVQNDSPPAREVVIAIDAGHGGEDPGAIGPSRTQEKNIALVIAKKLASKINKVHGMRAVLIREGDYFVSLRGRMRKAREHKADLFVSIHADAFKDSRVSGSSVYVLSQRGASSEHAKWLAKRENAADLIGGVSLEDKDNVLASVLLDLSQTASLEASIDVAERVLGGLKKIGNLHKKRVESAAFAVLKSPDIPSMLIETAYISNPSEEKKLRSEKFQDTLTSAILAGLVDYFRLRAPENSIMAKNWVKEHIISRGDTLSDIAERYKVSISSLREANSLRKNVIRVGQKLTIPTSGS